MGSDTTSNPSLADSVERRNGLPSAARPSFPLDEAVRRILGAPLLWGTIGLLAGGIALSSALLYSRTTSTCEGKMLHVPNTITSPYYLSPSLSSLVQLVVSRELMESIRNDLALKEDVKSLHNGIRIEIAPQDTLTLRLGRPTTAEAQLIVNTLMQRMVKETEKLRSAALARHVADFQAETARARKNYDEARRAQQQFLADNRLESAEALTTGIAVAQNAAADLELSMESAQAALASAKAKREHLVASQGRQSQPRPLSDALSESALKTSASGDDPDAGKVTNLSDDPAELADDEQDLDGASPLSEAKRAEAKRSSQLENATLAWVQSRYQSDAERRSLLRDKMRERQDRASHSAKLEQARNDYKRAQALLEKRLISQAEAEKAALELKTLEAEQHAGVKELADEIALIENRMNRMNESIARRTSTQLGSGVLAATFLEGDSNSPEHALALFELEVLGIEEELKHFTTQLKEKEKHLTSLSALQKEFAPHAENVRLLAQEWERVQRRLDEFEQAAASAAPELTIIQDAALAIDGVRSNKRLLFGTIFVGAFSLILSPFLYREWRRCAV